MARRKHRFIPGLTSLEKRDNPSTPSLVMPPPTMHEHGSMALLTPVIDFKNKVPPTVGNVGTVDIYFIRNRKPNGMVGVRIAVEFSATENIEHFAGIIEITARPPVSKTIRAGTTYNWVLLMDRSLKTPRKQFLWASKEYIVPSATTINANVTGFGRTEANTGPFGTVFAFTASDHALL
jgi:hypothetical protein